MTDTRPTPLPDDAQPNLVDRLFLRLEHTQTPLTIHVGLTFAGPLDGDVLAQALGDVLRDYPLLATVAVPSPWGYRRTKADIGDPAALLTSPASAAEWLAYVRRPLVPEAGLPVRLALGATGHGDDHLIVTLHHSVIDAVGAMQWIDRLAWRYGERVAGRCPPFLDAWHDRRYWNLLRRLPLRERGRMLARSAAAFGELLHSLRGIRCATFQDLPIPARGQTAWLTLALDDGDMAAVAGWRQSVGGTVNDVLLAAFVTACLTVWPEQGTWPVIVHLPVNLREPGEVLIGNRVADVRMVLANEACRNMTAALKAVKLVTPAARSRTNALARLLERGLAGYLPPALFREGVIAHLDQPDNSVLSLSFSNLGDLGKVPGDFGPVGISSMEVLGPLSVPPAISAWVATCRGRTTLCLGYIEPVVTPASAKAVAEAFRAALAKR
jgi:NRPS condensation-like uncharacterized protein